MKKKNKLIDFMAPKRPAEWILARIYVKIKWAFFIYFFFTFQNQIQVILTRSFSLVSGTQNKTNKQKALTG